MHYRLEGRTVVEEPDLYVWARWFEEGVRRVALTQVREKQAVSTVFLGLDHSFGTGPPLLFESMVVGGPAEGLQARYSTWDEAQAGHDLLVTWVELGSEGDPPSFEPPPKGIEATRRTWYQRILEEG
jgi:hypothetical protein